mgnify:CR=1 FL=1
MDKNFIRPLRENEIECRVSAINAKGVMLILYKDARVDQRILDETFGAFGLKRSHQCIDGNLYCTVEIRDSKTGEWIAKQDVGTTGYAEKEKSKASDSLSVRLSCLKKRVSTAMHHLRSNSLSSRSNGLKIMQSLSTKKQQCIK